MSQIKIDTVSRKMIEQHPFMQKLFSVSNDNYYPRRFDVNKTDSIYRFADSSLYHGVITYRSINRNNKHIDTIFWEIDKGINNHKEQREYSYFYSPVTRRRMKGDSMWLKSITINDTEYINYTQEGWD